MFAVVVAATLSIGTLVGVGFAAGAGPRVGSPGGLAGPPALAPLPTATPAPQADASAGTSLRRPLDPEAWPVVPAIDASLQQRLRAIFRAGQAMGNRAGVFAKVGDSITATTEFLTDVGCGAFDLARYTDLRPTIEAFRATPVPPGPATPWCATSNSFDRTSLAATIGWRSDQALEPSSTPLDPACSAARFGSPLACELHVLHPSIALIMFGTNDMSHDDLPLFVQQMSRIVRTCVAMGVIPVISTIPPRADSTTMDARVADYNRALLQVAATDAVPLWNYWLALSQPSMVDRGIGGDGVHPNAAGGCAPRCLATDFTDEGLRYGFNQRNFTALEVLRTIEEVVFDGGTPAEGPSFQVQDGTVSPAVVLAAQGQPVTWTLDAGDAEPHAVADGTGMRLFDSGVLRAGGAFTFAFQAAASFPFVDRLHRTLLAGTVGVPVRIEPAEPSIGAPVVIGWATRPGPPGVVFDVQVLRPGADWVDWRTGRTVEHGTFRAAQPGTFGFRARLRDPATGAATGWSPAAWVLVRIPRATGSA